MKIKHIFYAKKYSTFEDESQYVHIESIKILLQKMVELKAEHVNWVGMVDNLFTETQIVYALIFYDGKWDGAQVVDRLIYDANEPWSDDDWPTPFFHVLEKIENDRTKFVELLKGEKII